MPTRGDDEWRERENKETRGKNGKDTYKKGDGLNGRDALAIIITTREGKMQFNEYNKKNKSPVCIVPSVCLTVLYFFSSHSNKICE